MNPGSGRVPAGDRRSRPDTRLTCESDRRLCGLIGCGSGIEHGKMSAMPSALIDPAEVLAPLGDGDVFPLPDVANLVGMKRTVRSYAVDKGIIHTTDTGPGAKGRGRAGSLMVSRDEALLIIVSAALAAAIGVAVVTVIRTLRNSGASITADSVSIPLSGLGDLNKVNVS